MICGYILDLFISSLSGTVLLVNFYLLQYNKNSLLYQEGLLWLIPVDAEKSLDGRTIAARKARGKDEQKADVRAGY